MKNIDVDLSRFKSLQSLSCVESYLLYILNANNYDYKHLYALISYVSFSEICKSGCTRPLNQGHLLFLQKWNFLIWEYNVYNIDVKSRCAIQNLVLTVVSLFSKLCSRSSFITLAQFVSYIVVEVIQ